MYVNFNPEVLLNDNDKSLVALEDGQYYRWDQYIRYWTKDNSYNGNSFVNKTIDCFWKISIDETFEYKGVSKVFQQKEDNKVIFIGSKNND